MARLDDWQARLHDYISAANDFAFDFGEMDCCLFTAGAVEAITGKDPAAGFRGHYINEFSGLSMLARAGYAGPEGFLVEHFPEIPPAFAGAGDICVMAEDGALGVSVGDRVALIGEDGIRFAPAESARRAFRV